MTIDLNRYVEVISEMKLDVSDGGHVLIEMERGLIKVCPWNSYEDGDMFSTMEDGVTFDPASANDMLVLKLMGEIAEKKHAVRHEPPSRFTSESDAMDNFMGTAEERKQMELDHGPMIVKVNGEPADESLQKFALR